MRRVCGILLVFLLLLCGVAAAEDWEADERVWTLYDEKGAYLTCRAGRIWPDDEYITGDNALYRVTSADENERRAVAQYLGREPDAAYPAFRALAQGQPEKLIAMYCTHSDESYVPDDGDSSLAKGAGIYDVAGAFQKALEDKGMSVTLSEDTFLPHDAGAYRRSRATAEELLKQTPVALFDIHRDGIPDESEYEEEIDGTQASKVRLLVGRSNPNSDANRAFAKQVKATADEMYPGLIKDIFIGKGNYNQELYPKSLLLEFGTHTLSKERAIESTAFMADVVDTVLFGEQAQAEGVKQTQNKSGATGIWWIVGIAVLAAIVYALAATGSFSGMRQKLARGASEITGGLIGKKPRKK